MRSYLVICVLVAATCGVYGAKYPKDLPKCKAGDNECIPRVITEVLKKIRNGRQDLNLMSFDPLLITKLDILQGTESPLAISLYFRNLELYGIADAIIKKSAGFEQDPRTSKFEIEALVPQLVILGDYKVNGRVLILPVQGEGRSNLTLDNVAVQIKFKPSVTVKNGKDYIQTEKFALSFDTTRLYLRFENLFNGDKALGDNMNVFINDNWSDILNELKPGITEAFSQIISNIINAVFQKIPYSDVYL